MYIMNKGGIHILIISSLIIGEVASSNPSLSTRVSFISSSTIFIGNRSVGKYPDVLFGIIKIDGSTELGRENWYKIYNMREWFFIN